MSKFEGPAAEPPTGQESFARSTTAIWTSVPLWVGSLAQLLDLRTRMAFLGTVAG